MAPPGLVDCRRRYLHDPARRLPAPELRPVLSEAEDLQFRDREFDAVLSNGGFNHFNDPEAALRETARVAKAGARVVVADEMPDFLAFGHRLGLPGLDHWIASRLMSMATTSPISSSATGTSISPGLAAAS